MPCSENGRYLNMRRSAREQPPDAVDSFNNSFSNLYVRHRLLNRFAEREGSRRGVGRCQSPKSTAQVPEVLCTDHAVPLTMTLRHPLQNSVSSRIRGYVRLKRSHADCRVMPSAAPILAQLIPRSRAMVTHARRCSSTCPPASATSRTRPSRASSPRELQAGFSGSKGSDSAEA